MEFTRKKADCAYVANNLWLPKSKINIQATKQSLEVYPTNGTVYAKAGIKLWDESVDHLIVPKYYIDPVDYGRYDFEFVKLDQVEFPKTKIQHRVTPRDASQATAIETLTRSDHGILNLACGKGKTTIALAAAANVGTPTIVIVNNRSLMTQWEEMVRKHWSYQGSIGRVQQSEFEWKHPIVVAMIHTLANKSKEWPAEFRRYFGVAIFDEVHHLSAPTFVQTADLFFGRRWGLTATATRADGLEVAIHHHLGPVIYSDLAQSLVPDIWFISTDVAPKTALDATHLFCDRSGLENLAKIRGWLGKHELRNRIIREEIKKAQKSGRKILAVTHSRDQAELLHEQYPGSGLCTGKMKAEERLKMVQERPVTFATIQIASEALDVPSLDTLFVLTPFGDHNALQQCLGRIQRSHPGKKQPMAVILEDNISYCHALCGKMRRYMREKAYPFKKIRRSE
jgi:superfamily II DNA or RNA helicase